VVLGKFLGGMNEHSQPRSFSSHLSDGVPEDAGGSSRWESYRPGMRNFPGCPWPRALINTKILPTALGLLQPGRAFRFK